MLRRKALPQRHTAGECERDGRGGEVRCGGTNGSRREVRDGSDHDLYAPCPRGPARQCWHGLPTVLPVVTLAGTIEPARIHRAAALIGARTAWVTTRPFRAPHHTILDAWLIGGGNIPMPGEVSLAHHGVLFLDELPEFRDYDGMVVRDGCAAAACVRCEPDG
jgi:hypothetical protein